MGKNYTMLWRIAPVIFGINYLFLPSLYAKAILIHTQEGKPAASFAMIVMDTEGKVFNRHSNKFELESDYLIAPEGSCIHFTDDQGKVEYPATEGDIAVFGVSYAALYRQPKIERASIQETFFLLPGRMIKDAFQVTVPGTMSNIITIQSGEPEDKWSYRIVVYNWMVKWDHHEEFASNEPRAVGVREVA